MVLLQRKLYFLKDPEGVQHFQGVFNFFQGGGGGGGGGQMLISIETHIACDFFFGGGGPDPISPLWIRTCTYLINIWAQTVRGLLDFQFLAQDFQIEEGGTS